MAGYFRVPVGLTDPDDLAAEAFDEMTSGIPGFVPADGHLETWMVQIGARWSSVIRFLVQTVGDDIFRGFGASIVGIAPIEAVPATVKSTWVMVDDTGYTTEAGTLVAIPLSGSDTVAFKLQSDLVIAPGDDTATDVILEAVEAGTYANDIPAALSQGIDTPAWVDTVSTTEATAGGVDDEDDTIYLNRLRDEFTLLAPRPIYASEFAIMARRVAGVYRAMGIDLYSPARAIENCQTTNTSPTITCDDESFTSDDVDRQVTGTGVTGGTTVLAFVSATELTLSANATATNDPVTLTLGALDDLPRAVHVVVVDENGEEVPDEVREAVDADLQGRREINFLVTVGDPTYTVVDIDFHITVADGFDKPDTLVAAKAALESWISPANWGGGDQSPPSWNDADISVRLLEAAHVLYQVDGVEAVTTITLNAGTADVALAGPGGLPDPTSEVTGTAS